MNTVQYNLLHSQQKGLHLSCLTTFSYLLLYPQSTDRPFSTQKKKQRLSELKGAIFYLRLHFCKCKFTNDLFTKGKFVVRVIVFIIYYLFSCLYRVVTITFLKKNTFLAYIMFKLFCRYSFWHISDVEYFFCTFKLILPQVYYYCYYLSPLSRLFKIVYLKQTKYLGYTLLQQFYRHSYWYLIIISRVKCSVLLHQYFPKYKGRTESHEQQFFVK